MAGRRFQNPTPFKRGRWWCLMYWSDEWRDGKLIRKRVRQKLAPVEMPVRKVKKIADELMRPLNQGLVTVGGAMKFADYVRIEYIPGDYKVLAKSTQDRYLGVIGKYLEPAFGAVPAQGHFAVEPAKVFRSNGRLVFVLRIQGQDPRRAFKHSRFRPEERFPHH
jgi:hypothetical protein